MSFGKSKNDQDKQARYVMITILSMLKHISVYCSKARLEFHFCLFQETPRNEINFSKTLCLRHKLLITRLSDNLFVNAPIIIKMLSVSERVSVA